jgi:heme/copper-type cytochrome/quinol oxidase subunit 1
MHLRARIAGGVLLALALLLSAAVLWFGETQLGWFSYAPLSDQANLVVVTGRRKLALIVGTAGLALLAFLAGFTVGRRSEPGGSP